MARSHSRIRTRAAPWRPFSVAIDRETTASRYGEAPKLTKLAIISDVHADLHALEDALRSIECMGCEHVVCAGDIADYGRYPEKTIALLRERGVPTIRGNHDRWALVAEAHADPDAQLSPRAIRFLAALPTK